MDPGRALFLGVAILTHAALGYALVSRLTDVDPALGVVFGVLPDLDFLFPAALEWPFVHRGLTHTPVFAIGIFVIAWYVMDRKFAVASGAAIGSHLLLDSLSPMGIAWAYPLVSRNVGIGLPVHGPLATLLLWMVVGVLVYGNEFGRYDWFVPSRD